MKQNSFELAEQVVEAMKVVGALDPVYEGIMGDVGQMKDDLPLLAARVAQARKEVRDLKERLGLRESQIASTIDWKALGSNDTQRKAKLPAVYAANSEYRALSGRLSNAQYNADAAEEEYEAAKRVMNAVGHAARLHSAYVIAMSSITVPVPMPGEGEAESALDVDDELGI